MELDPTPRWRRWFGRSDPVVPKGAAPDWKPRFPIARRFGYEISDVDSLLDQLDGLGVAPADRTAAVDLLHSARFHLARRNGYDPLAVDQEIDRRLKELES
jgi:hypothetical protein